MSNKDIKIHKYLCDDKFRKEISEYLMEHCPGILECNSNPREDSYLSFTEWNHPSGKGRMYEKWKTPLPHVFTFSILAPKTDKRPGSAHCLWNDILEDTTLSEFRNRDMGYKLRTGLLHPDLDSEVRELIKGFVVSYDREKRLNQLLKK